MIGAAGEISNQDGSRGPHNKMAESCGAACSCGEALTARARKVVSVQGQVGRLQFLVDGETQDWDLGKTTDWRCGALWMSALC